MENSALRRHSREGGNPVGSGDDPQSNGLQQTQWHADDVVEGFTRTYRVHALVFFEQLERMEEAIPREKQIKKWNRAWKIRLIEESNPEWRDLYP